MGKKAKISQLKSFYVAFCGIWAVFLNERNFRFHTLAALIAIGCCWFFHVEKHEWITVLILIALVLCAETINTAIEYICDLISPQYSPYVKTIKDIAAGSVLLAAIFSIIIGCIIFIPHIISVICK